MDGVNLRPNSKYGKIQTRKNSIFGQYLRGWWHSLVFVFTTRQADAITDKILDVADKFLDTDQELWEKSNEENETSATFLGSLNAVAVYLTRLSTSRQKIFRKHNIALAIQNKSNSFTFIAKEENYLLDIQCVDGEITNKFSLAKFFVPQTLLIKAKSTHVYSFVYRSGLLFSRSFGNKTVQSLVMAASVPERKISNLQDPVVITFQDQGANKTKTNKINTCQFWVPEKNGIYVVSGSLSLQWA